MKQFYLRKLHSEVARLTQQHWATGAKELSLISGTRAHPFTTAHMSSDNGEFMYELGRGTFDPQKLVAIMYHYSVTSPDVVDFQALVDEWKVYFFGVATNVDIWRSIVAFTVGRSKDESIAANRLGKMPAEAIRTKLNELITTQSGVSSVHSTMFNTIIGEYALHMLMSLNLVHQSTPYVYRVSRHGTFPDYAAYKDAVICLTLRRQLDTLATVDLSRIQTALQDPSRSINPSMISMEIANGAINAYDRVRATYDPKQIVDAVANVSWLQLNPVTPDDAAPKQRVVIAPGMANLLSNAAWFAAIQAEVRKNGLPRCTFNDEEMAAVVIPMFVEAVNTCSPYKERTLAECVAHLGSMENREYDGSISHYALYESCDFGREAVAFTAVRQTRNGRGRFLMPEAVVSDALTDALGPVSDTFSVESLVKGFFGTIEMAQRGHFPVSKDGSEILLAMPSMSSVLHTFDIDESTLLAAIESNAPTSELAITTRFAHTPVTAASGEDDLEEVSDSQKDRLAILQNVTDRVTHSYYVSLFVLALTRSSNYVLVPVATELSSLTKDTDNAIVDGDLKEAPNYNLMVEWHIPYSGAHPLGLSANRNNEVITHEPLEALVYLGKIEPSRKVAYPSLPLSDYEKSLHIWLWHQATQPVSYTDAYETVISGKTYKVDVTETQILNLGYARPRLRFHMNTGTRALVKMWLSWYEHSTKMLEDLQNSTQDDVVRSAVEGRLLAVRIALVTRLRAIGTSRVGLNLVRTVERDVIQQMHQQGKIDAMKTIHSVPHQVMTQTWAGLVLMGMLDLMSIPEHDMVMKELSNGGALAAVYAMMTDSSTL